MFPAQRKVQQRNVFTNNKFNQNGQNFVRKTQFTRNVATNTTNTNRDAHIARNLQHMKEVSHKKKLAQEYYYTGRSPLVRNGTPQKRWGSVRQRLGERNQNTQPIRKNRVTFNNERNINNRVNKQNFVRKNNQNNQLVVGEFRSDKIIRSQRMQQKRIRFQNGNDNNFTNVKMVRKQVKPTNYTVSVKNDHGATMIHKPLLNPQLQQEIKVIQSKPVRPVVVPVIQEMMVLPNEERIMAAATTRTLNERFTVNPVYGSNV